MAKIARTTAPPQKVTNVPKEVEQPNDLMLPPDKQLIELFANIGSPYK
jgi:hypothetical protein